MVSMRCYSTAILTLSLPILATTTVPCLAENETLPSIDFCSAESLSVKSIEDDCLVVVETGDVDETTGRLDGDAAVFH